MLKKIGRDALIIFCLVAMFASTYRPLMGWLCDLRNVDKWWGTYQCNHGDLITMSGLDIISTFNPPPVKWTITKPNYDGPKNAVLYIYGDSHTYSLKDTLFAGLSGFHYISRYGGGPFHLDTSKKNVLIVEIGEQAVREFFTNLRMFDELRDTATINKAISLAGIQPKQQLASFLPDMHMDLFFNKNINQNLECNLFNYGFIVPMFQSKAALNYYVFDRASGDVVVSNDKQFLFFRPTVSNTEICGYRTPVPAEEITSLINKLNAVYDHYKQAGFTQVYLSIIPNCPTIMQPEGYNQLIPSIQNDSRLRLPYIDVYGTFKRSKQILYWHGDTHWNFEGIQVWLNLVNDQLKKINAES